MKDRVPKYPGRVKMTMPDGTVQYVTIERADEPTQEGTPLNKATFLKDDTAAILGLSQADPTVDDAFMSLAVSAAGGAILRINVTVGGKTAIAGIPISGATDMNGNALVTTGKPLIAKATGTSVTLSTPEYVDMPKYSQTITIPAGFSGLMDVNFTIPAGTDGGYKQYTTSQSVQFSPYVKTFDACLVGAGNTGGSGSIPAEDDYYQYYYGGNGGDGGKVYNAFGLSAAERTLNLTVGAPSGGVSKLLNNSGSVNISSASGISAKGGRGWTSTNTTTQSTKGSDNTTLVFNSEAYPRVGGGGGGGGCYGYGTVDSGKSGGSPYGGAGGLIGSAYEGGNATGIGGGGGGGAINSRFGSTYSGGLGYQGAIFLRWHY